ncbi:SDR family oxidoreductase [Halococcus salifodinae]|uniref:Nmra-like family protein n=1 Tax=Halococcus salifodinae DSM 8989 TaxID=1227456 RepID=M0ND74_9EURY|nr:NAD(P)H-binding protein [Halococcus salifodinae]EMA54635.1 nmra-like family protein [Halococcus salifodinae DSM 8989]
MSTTARTLVTGGTGRLGQTLLPRLREAGHKVRATSRSPPTDDETEWRRMNLADGIGIRDALTDVDVVIHTASAPLGDAEAVDVDGTTRLLDAAADAGVSNFVYISIVGIEDIPYSYYEHKLTAERAVEASDVPSTVLRATQFHSFVHDVLGMIARLPIWPLATKMQLQPIDTGVVADRLVEHATPEPSGRLDPIGGPEIRTAGELARAYRDVRGTWRPIVRVPVPGTVFSAFRDGKATCPDHAIGTVTWEEWLETTYEETASS